MAKDHRSGEILDPLISLAIRVEIENALVPVIKTQTDILERIGEGNTKFAIIEERQVVQRRLCDQRHTPISVALEPTTDRAPRGGKMSKWIKNLIYGACWATGGAAAVYFLPLLGAVLIHMGKAGQ